MNFALRNMNRLRPLACGILFFLWGNVAQAQLSANFTANHTSGCAPLVVAFSNTSTGASSGTLYVWSFGNGNTDSTLDPTTPVGATFATPGAYNVTLTEINGDTVSSRTLTIQVYDNPTVSFTSNPTTGCSPLPVIFNSTSTAGAGVISEYFWDFGDGHTARGQQVSDTNTYYFAIVPKVRLTVMNSMGCTATSVDSNLISIRQGYQPAFSTDSTVLCSVSDPVAFSNLTNGPSSLSYTWNFGDGTTSTANSPSHIYGQKGSFTVTLIATTQEGCVDTLTQNAFVNVANFQPTIAGPSQICSGDSALLIDSGLVKPVSSVWSFQDDHTTASGDSASHTFAQPGSFTVSLTGQFRLCLASATKTVTVLPTPPLKGFLMSYNTLCGFPDSVHFTDTLPGDVQWAWYGGEHGSSPGSYYETFSTQQTGSFYYNSQYYNSFGNVTLYPKLIVWGADGCSASITLPLVVDTSLVGLKMIINGKTVVTPNSYYDLCSPDTVQLIAVPPPGDSITSYRWFLGNGEFTNVDSPINVYSGNGIFPISLAYQTKNGCSGDVELMDLQLTQLPPQNFTISTGDTVCGNTPITFSPTPGTDEEVWYFGDGGSSLGIYPVHQYLSPGTYTVTLTAGAGGCLDTIVKENLITVLPDFPKIYQVLYSCNNRGHHHLYRQRPANLGMAMGFW